MIPKTPFSTPLSSSAKETETRIRNLFQGPKKRPALPVLALSVTTILLCGSLVSFQVLAAPEGQDEPLNAAAVRPILTAMQLNQPEASTENKYEPLSLPILSDDIISQQGWPGSPEYMAFAEWMDFLGKYDPDGSILNAASQGQIEIPSGYSAYTCYSWEMAETLNELCSKYGLTILGESVVAEETDLFAICGGIGEENTSLGGWYYPDGTLRYDGSCVLPGQDCKINYQFARAVKGSLNTLFLSIGNVDAYQQWEYTAQNGVPLLLALSDTKALLVADTDRSFVVLNILLSDGEILSKETMEAFAETFDFSII